MTVLSELLSYIFFFVGLTHMCTVQKLLGELINSIFGTRITIRNYLEMTHTCARQSTAVIGMEFSEIVAFFL